MALDEDNDLADPDMDLQHDVLDHERLANLARLIAGLEEDEQEMLRLRFAAGLNFRAIAAVLNRKESAVKMALYRLLARLEEQMDDNDD